MKTLFIVITTFVTILLSACHLPSAQLRPHYIAMQPIGQYDTSQIRFIQQQVQRFFNQPVIILAPATMPASFLNQSKGERYSADSIIQWLSHNKTPDSLTEIVGLTHKDIFTTITNKNGEIQQPAWKYTVWGIFGLGYCPGRSAVVSDYRLKTNDIHRFRHRLRTVVIHEIGHNLGLPHCNAAHCIMNDANEKIATVDNSSDGFCSRCRTQVKNVE